MKQFACCIVASLIAPLSALSITAPTQGQTLDPTQPITVTWTRTGADPEYIDLAYTGNGGLYSNVVVARNILTTDLSYFIPANSITTYGTNFIINALSSSGDVLASSPSFDLSTSAYISSETFTGTVTAATTDTAQTAFGVASSTSFSWASESNARSSLFSGSTASETSLSGTSTVSSGFSTSTISSSKSSSIMASSTSASGATTSANAQPRLGSNSQIAFTAAGVLAGLAALLA